MVEGYLHHTSNSQVKNPPVGHGRGRGQGCQVPYVPPPVKQPFVPPKKVTPPQCEFAPPLVAPVPVQVKKGRQKNQGMQDFDPQLKEQLAHSLSSSFISMLGGGIASLKRRFDSKEYILALPDRTWLLTAKQKIGL